MNKYELIKMFEDLHLLEKQAKDLYEEFLKTLSDQSTAEVIKGIRDDEIRHMQIAQDSIKLIKDEN